jgi:hypothetical protein
VVVRIDSARKRMGKSCVWLLTGKSRVGGGGVVDVDGGGNKRRKV